MKPRAVVLIITVVIGLAVLIQLDRLRSSRPAKPQAPAGPAGGTPEAVTPETPPVEASLEKQWPPRASGPRRGPPPLPPVGGKMPLEDLRRHISAALAPVEELERLESVARTAQCYERAVEGVTVEEAVYRDPSILDDFAAGRVVPTDTGVLVRRCTAPRRPLAQQWREDLHHAAAAAEMALLELDRKILEDIAPGEVPQAEVLGHQKALRRALASLKNKRPGR